MSTQPGPIVLLGSGETAPHAQKIYHTLFSALATQVRVAILETPAGFEPNSDYVAGQIKQYLHKRLQNFRPEVTVIPARKRGTPYSPDDPDLLQPLYDANVILMGPGSPTYAVRQLQQTFAWHAMRARHRQGAALVFASAATLAMSRFTMPVYEIYKVGEDLHWKEGLDFFGDYGLSVIFVSHWNNKDGGDVLDTSRCYLGQDRFERLLEMLPPDEERRIVGIDESTALIIEPATGACRVLGAGTVTIQQGNQVQIIEGGETFPMTLLGELKLPAHQDGIPEPIWVQLQERVAEAEKARAATPKPDAAVLALTKQRTAARRRRDWSAADRLRDEIADLGWRVVDTPEGPQLEPMDGTRDLSPS
ncbi:MAG: cysteinyl-tRNA synthetase [Caldilineaceae bacterium]|nr:cysteinyl-tRNA synthetase [Caldilineaceae bacterium]